MKRLRRNRKHPQYVLGWSDGMSFQMNRSKHLEKLMKSVAKTLKFANSVKKEKP